LSFPYLIFESNVLITQEKSKKGKEDDRQLVKYQELSIKNQKSSIKNPESSRGYTKEKVDLLDGSLPLPKTGSGVQ
jgi:hypothetical protein